MEQFFLYLWVGLLVLFAVIEGATAGLFTIWFALGALAALIAAAVGMPIWGQILIFILISAAALAGLRPLARRFTAPRKVRTNADRVLGKHALVLQKIDNTAGTGQVKVDGQIWSARTENDESVPEGTQVEVLRIQGVKLVVRAVLKTANQ